MAEQFIRGYHIEDVKDLYTIVGSNDQKIIIAVNKLSQLDEVDDLISSLGINKALNHIITGKLNSKNAYHYFRTLELFLEVKGKMINDEIVLPGRGWQEIKTNFFEWGLPTLGKAWCNKDFYFPWQEGNTKLLPDWPLAIVLKKSDVLALKEEIKGFDKNSLSKHPLPERLQGLDEEVLLLISTLKKWLNKTTGDLVLLLDGQQ